MIMAMKWTLPLLYLLVKFGRGSYILCQKPPAAGTKCLFDLVHTPEIFSVIGGLGYHEDGPRAKYK